MTIKTLYRFKRADGGITVSPNKPNVEYTELFRIIADEGKAVTKDGENLYSVIDTDNIGGFHEVDAPRELDENGGQIVFENATGSDVPSSVKFIKKSGT